MKGAPDFLLQSACKIFSDGKEISLSEEKKKEVEKKIEEFTSMGLRVLGCSLRNMEKEKLDASLEKDMTFVGLITLCDPPREGVKEAIQKCKEAKMQLLMLTGDHKQTAIAIAKELDILNGEKALSGVELDRLNDEALDHSLSHIKVLARVSAEHKMRIIMHLQKKGEVVAMTGDGMNDAPSVEKADIGIAMGITGTDVTKSVSDLIILDDNFNTIVYAVEEGRAIYDNIIKFTSYLFSCNLTEVLIIFFSIFFLGEFILHEPVMILNPIHLLWINIVTDGFPAIALALDPLSPNAMKHPPRGLNDPLFSRERLIRLVAIASIISSLTIGVFLMALPKGVLEAKTAAFTALIVFELSKTFLLRIPYKIGFFSNRWLIKAVLLSFLLQLGVVYFPFLHAPFDTVSLGWLSWGWILAGIGVFWIIGYPLEQRAKVKY